MRIPRSILPQAISRRAAFAALAVLALLAGAPAGASMSNSVAIPLANLGVRGADSASLVARVASPAAMLRAPENANYVEVFIPAGKFDLDASKIVLAVEGGKGVIAEGSVSVTTMLDKAGRVERFVASAKVRVSEEQPEQPIELALRVKIVEQPVAYRPVRAYVVEGSMSAVAFGDVANFNFKVAYALEPGVGDAKFLLNKVEVVDDAGRTQKSGDFGPFTDMLLAGTEKTYAQSVALQGPKPENRRGVYRSTSLGLDGEGRPFLVDYEIELGGELTQVGMATARER